LNEAYFEHFNIILNKTAFQSKQAILEQNTKNAFSDLDLDPMTLTFGFYVDIPIMYLQTKVNFLG